LLQRSMELKKDIRIAYVDAGTILARQKRYAEAANALQHAVALDPEEPETHYQLGRVYQTMNKSEQAQREYAKVRQLHKKSVDEDLARKMSDAPPSPSPPSQ
jgi:Flp pilus assembly protein TadD